MRRPRLGHHQGAVRARYSGVFQAGVVEISGSFHESLQFAKNARIENQFAEAQGDVSLINLFCNSIFLMIHTTSHVAVAFDSHSVVLDHV